MFHQWPLRASVVVTFPLLLHVELNGPTTQVKKRVIFKIKMYFVKF